MLKDFYNRHIIPLIAKIGPKLNEIGTTTEKTVKLVAKDIKGDVVTGAKVVGAKIEKTVSENKSLDFLKNDTFENFKLIEDDKDSGDVFQQLTDYVNTCSASKVKPGNFYSTNENSPNFTSNVLNVQKFYNVEPIGEYDGLTNLAPKKYVESPMCEDVTKLNEVSKQTCFSDRNAFDNEAIFNPDNWRYKNELPMNGGKVLPGVVGFDSLESAFSLYDDPGDKTCLPGKNLDCFVKQDDLRMGLGYPNKEFRETR